MNIFNRSISANDGVELYEKYEKNWRDWALTQKNKSGVVECYMTDIWLLQQKFIKNNFLGNDFNQLYIDIFSLHKVRPLSQNWGLIFDDPDVDPDLTFYLSLLTSSECTAPSPTHPIFESHLLKDASLQNLRNKIIRNPHDWTLKKFIDEANFIFYREINNKTWANGENYQTMESSEFLRKVFNVPINSDEFESRYVSSKDFPVTSVRPSDIFVINSMYLEKMNSNIFSGLNTVGIWYGYGWGMDSLAGTLIACSISPTDISVVTGLCDDLLNFETYYELEINECNLILTDCEGKYLINPEKVGPFKLNYTSKFNSFIPTKSINKKILSSVSNSSFN
jgi:hypothetical protein